jgi:hypothetical protein
VRVATFAFVALVGGHAVADPSVTTAPVAGRAASAAPSVTAHVGEAPSAAPHGLAIGVELGEPASATIGWFTGKLALVGALGTGTVEGLGLQGHGDVQYEVHRLAANMPLRVGLGARLYHHGYHPASIDELPDTHLGVRASASIAMERGKLQLYAEVAPGIDVLRSSSCNLASGARSVCPHAQEAPVFLQLAVGARWFFSR